MTSYWDKFDVIENMDEYDNMEVSEESDDDIDMKELVGAAGGNAEDEDNDYMINDEI